MFWYFVFQKRISLQFPVTFLKISQKSLKYFLGQPKNLSPNLKYFENILGFTLKNTLINSLRKKRLSFLILLTLHERMISLTHFGCEIELSQNYNGICTRVRVKIIGRTTGGPWKNQRLTTGTTASFIAGLEYNLSPVWILLWLHLLKWRPAHSEGFWERDLLDSPLKSHLKSWNPLKSEKICHQSC